MTVIRISTRYHFRWIIRVRHAWNSWPLGRIGFVVCWKCRRELRRHDGKRGSLITSPLLSNIVTRMWILAPREYSGYYIQSILYLSNCESWWSESRQNSKACIFSVQDRSKTPKIDAQIKTKRSFKFYRWGEDTYHHIFTTRKYCLPRNYRVSSKDHLPNLLGHLWRHRLTQ